MNCGAASKAMLWFYVMIILYYKIISIQIIEYNEQIEKSNEYISTTMCYFLRECSSPVGTSLLHPHPYPNLGKFVGKQENWRMGKSAVKCLLDMTDITLMNTEKLIKTWPALAQANQNSGIDGKEAL